MNQISSVFSQIQAVQKILIVPGKLSIVACCEVPHSQVAGVCLRSEKIQQGFTLPVQMEGAYHPGVVNEGLQKFAVQRKRL